MTTSADVSYTFDGNFERVMDTSPKLYWYGLDGQVARSTTVKNGAVPRSSRILR